MNAPKNSPEDQDPVWEFLDAASTHTASPRFSDDVLRAARLSESEKSGLGGWLKIPAFAGCAALVIATFFYISSEKPAPHVTDSPSDQSDSLTVLEDELSTELLSLAIDSPSLFSDEDILALIL